MLCVDCAKVANDVPPLRKQCAYHALVTGNDAPNGRQALAIMIDPDAFEAAAKSHAYFCLASPLKPDKTVAYERRAIVVAYEAADRVAMLYGMP